RGRRLGLGKATRELPADLRLVHRPLPERLADRRVGLVVELAPLLRPGKDLDHLERGRPVQPLAIREHFRLPPGEKAVACHELAGGGAADPELLRAIGLEGGVAPLLPQPLAPHPPEARRQLDPRGLEPPRALQDLGPKRFRGPYLLPLRDHVPTIAGRPDGSSPFIRPPGSEGRSPAAAPRRRGSSSAAAPRAGRRAAVHL